MLDNIARTRGDKLFDAAIVGLLVVIMVLIIYPLWFVIVASVSDPRLIYDDPFLLFPRSFTVASFELVFENREIWNGYANTILYTSLGTFINLAMTVAGAYPLSRRDFRGRGIITFFFTFTMFFSGGLIPLYLLVRGLGMLNTIWAMVVPQAVAVYNLIIMRTFFQSRIPRELEDAALIDGCSNVGLLVRVVLPLSMPIIAVMILFYGIGHWNSYFSALVFLSSRSRYPLQMVLREILIQGEMSSMLTIAYDDQYAQRMVAKMGLRFAVIIVSTIPIFVIYPMLQRFFKEGIMIGALKG
jgi:putative aldouronate transport system permease protein